MHRSAPSHRRLRTAPARRRFGAARAGHHLAVSNRPDRGRARPICRPCLARHCATAVWGKPTQVTVPRGNGGFAAVSCVGATDCTAVGGTSSTASPIALTETDGAWGNVVTFGGGGGGGAWAHWSSVSCNSSQNCTAVGAGGGFAASTPRYSTETNGVWGPVAGFSFPGPNDGSEMNSVSCPAVGDCVAVGHFQ